MYLLQETAFQLANKANAGAERIDIVIREEIVNEELILKQSLSDSEAFKPIYEKYFKNIFLFLLHHTSENEKSTNLTQRGFTTALDRAK